MTRLQTCYQLWRSAKRIQSQKGNEYGDDVIKAHFKNEKH